MKFDLKERCKTYSFWFAMLSAVLLLVQAIGEPLGLTISEDTYMSIVNAVLGIFVVLGIISDPTDKTTDTSEDETNNSSDSTTDSDESKTN